MATETPLPIRLAQTLGITSSLILSGMTLSTSLTTVPRLLESPPSLLLQQWGHMYDRGKKTGSPIALLSSTSFFYLAYKAHTSLSLSHKVYSYILAGLLSIGIIPYTFVVLVPTNRQLLRKVEVLGKVELSREDEKEMREAERSAHQLVDWWGVLNLGRGVLLVGSGVLGFWASLR
ncbi:hypothetical protein BKA64DRAFT_749649 [Cadophora sp. MPI-SDFR-AT-0126]|nr:hypothetical protein BKA64DRAFT_749649 [Leotiomycetes sp. MPI-SDFR-AT-0126]